MNEFFAMHKKYYSNEYFHDQYFVSDPHYDNIWLNLFIVNDESLQEVRLTQHSPPRYSHLKHSGWVLTLIPFSQRQSPQV